jgi:hypothetical protein
LEPDDAVEVRLGGKGERPAETTSLLVEEIGIRSKAAFEPARKTQLDGHFKLRLISDQDSRERFSLRQPAMRAIRPDWYASLP